MNVFQLSDLSYWTEFDAKKSNNLDQNFETFGESKER